MKCDRCFLFYHLFLVFVFNVIHSLFAPGPIRSGERIGPGAKRLGTRSTIYAMIYAVFLHYTVNHKKTWHFIFDYNYNISWPIFTLFAANETGINALQWNYTFSEFTLAVSCKTFSQHEMSNSARNVKFRSQSSQCFIV